MKARDLIGPRALLALSYLGFISLGLPDTVLGTAWPAMRSEFGRPLDDAGPIVLLATLGVALSGAFSGSLLARFQTGTVLTGSTTLAALALLAFAFAPSWWFTLPAALVAGFGGGAVDAALNGHVARHHSVRQMNWLHGFWGVGATLGPLAVAATLRAEGSWRLAYGGLGLVELLLALTFLMTAGAWSSSHDQDARATARPRLTPAMWTSVGFFFVYTALEASAGLWCASYLIATKGTSPSFAGLVVGLYWGALMVGRFLLGASASAIGATRLVRLSCWTALLALIPLLIPGSPTWLVALALCLLGFALAPVYPSLMHDTPRRFGADAAAHLVGYQIAGGSAGIALVPWLIGVLARRTSLQVVPACLAVLATALIWCEARRRRQPSTW